MAFYDGYLLAQDEDFRARVEFCAAQQGRTMGWVIDNMLRIAAEPGLADAYAYALATGVENPGRAESVITDGQINAAVAAVGTGGS